jgi:hypothetical protein
MTQKQFDAIGRSLARSLNKAVKKLEKEGKSEIRFTIEVKLKLSEK